MERISQHQNPVVGQNMRRLRKERDMKATQVIAKLHLADIIVTTGSFFKVKKVE